MQNTAVPIAQSLIAEGVPDAHERLDAYSLYAVALVWAVLLLRIVDLQIIAVLLEPLKREFGITDTQLGLLSGFAFSVLYGTLGIPIAWLADRTSRRNIIAVAVGLWSAMTCLCGLATSFTTLFAARVGVGIGEAGGTAPAYSLIADYCPPRYRSRVFAILNSAVPIGVFTGLLIGGLVAARYGWRAAFAIVGLPGIAVALLVRATLREPQRGASEGARHKAPPVPARAALGYLLRLRSYRHLVMATSLFTLGAMASGIWLPTFFIRVHHMAPADVTTRLALIYGAGGLIGVLLGGFIADRLIQSTGDKRWLTRLCAVCALATLPFVATAFLLDKPTGAFLFLIGFVVLMHAWMGPAYGAIQSLAGVRRRAMAAGVNLLAINLIAYGTGPLLVGAASDYWSARLGADGLRYAILLVVCGSYSWAALHFLLAGRTVREDLAAAASESALER